MPQPDGHRSKQNTGAARWDQQRRTGMVEELDNTHSRGSGFRLTESMRERGRILCNHVGWQRTLLEILAVICGHCENTASGEALRRMEVPLKTSFPSSAATTALLRVLNMGVVVGMTAVRLPPAATATTFIMELVREGR